MRLCICVIQGGNCYIGGWYLHKQFHTKCSRNESISSSQLEFATSLLAKESIYYTQLPRAHEAHWKQRTEVYTSNDLYWDSSQSYKLASSSKASSSASSSPSTSSSLLVTNGCSFSSQNHSSCGVVIPYKNRQVLQTPLATEPPSLVPTIFKSRCSHACWLLRKSISTLLFENPSCFLRRKSLTLLASSAFFCASLSWRNFFLPRPPLSW